MFVWSTAIIADGDSNSKFGVVDVNKNKVVCLRTKNKNLTENSAVSIVLPDEKPQRILTADVEKKLENSCAANGSDAGDDEASNAYYSLKNLSESERLGFGIAVFDSSSKVKSVNGFAQTDTNGDGKPERFRLCASSEGLHLTVWNGTPLKSQRLWHSYYYVNYDTMPDCRKKDYEDTEK